MKTFPLFGLFGDDIIAKTSGSGVEVHRAEIFREERLVRRWVWSVRVCSAALLALCSGCFTPTTGADAADGSLFRCIAPDESDRLADQVLQLVNLEREEIGLAPVALNPTLGKIAGDYACRMVEGDFFGHRDPDSGDGPGERAIGGKYSYYAVGENLAAGQETPAEVMRVWMDSPSHREIILDPKWREIGIAVRSGGAYSIYWVQEFGDPAGQ